MTQKTGLLFVLLAATALAISASAADPSHQTPTPVAAADYVSDETIDGSGLTLDPLAAPDGATLQFAGRGPRGRFTISGRENLQNYAAMLRAVAELEKMDRNKMFGNAAGQAAKAPVEAAAKLVADPGKTIAALPKGAMSFLQRTGRQIKESSRQIAEGSANSTGAADLVAFGRPYMANPDLVERFRHGWPLADLPDMAYWWTPQGARGYTDFPSHAPGTA